ncbi:MAG: hypothetical protein IKK67_09725 [Bacteroidaceae bacterium]|nr:hypothetical protein [Bacteroidaceae bacterium]
MTAADRQFLIECLCEDLVPMLMEEYGLTDMEAINLLYQSNTFAKIEDPQTGLYYQGAVYVFEYLKEEIDGKRN